jgi:hypothetical protein
MSPFPPGLGQVLRNFFFHGFSRAIFLDAWQFRYELQIRKLYAKMQTEITIICVLEAVAGFENSERINF